VFAKAAATLDLLSGGRIEAHAVIDRAAREPGRDPREIRRIYNPPGAFTAAARATATRRSSVRPTTGRRSRRTSRRTSAAAPSSPPRRPIPTRHGPSSKRSPRENLLAHLEYEEQGVEATVRRVRELP
jgi:alkanesulfonate monooxygenase SsuD/methylene tetrahydromethanopterin reductase-like flavin-dependent oxidoreductase (luciferase family)